MITQQQTDKMACQILNLFVAKGKEFKGVNEIFAKPFTEEDFLYATNGIAAVRFHKNIIPDFFYKYKEKNSRLDFGKPFEKSANCDRELETAKLKTFFKEYQTLKKSIVDAGKANNELPRKYNKTYIVKFQDVYYKIEQFKKLFETVKILGIGGFCQIFKKGLLTNLYEASIFDFGNLQIVLSISNFYSDESVIINNNILLNFNDYV